MAEVREQVWATVPRPQGTDPVVLDIDASLVEIHSENKELAAPTYKGGFGFHPMFCFADAAARRSRDCCGPGNAGANTVADHVSVLDAGIAQLPEAIRAGHRAGDDPSSVDRAVVVRADSAGCTEGFLSACRERNVGFFVTARSNPQVTAAIFDAIGVEEVWLPALSQAGEEKEEGACVAELTSLIDDDKLPERHPAHRPTRTPAPRGPAQPLPLPRRTATGASTPTRTVTRVDLDVTMRAHAHVEQHIERLKDSGLCRFPFTSFEANANWMMVVALAGRPGALVPAALHGRAWQERPAQGLALGDLPCSGPPRAAVLASASCASSTGGPRPRCCSRPTVAWRCIT